MTSGNKKITKKKGRNWGTEENDFFSSLSEISRRTHELLLIVLISGQRGWRLGREDFTSILCGRHFFLSS